MAVPAGGDEVAGADGGFGVGGIWAGEGAAAGVIGAVEGGDYEGGAVAEEGGAELTAGAGEGVEGVEVEGVGYQDDYTGREGGLV